MTDTAQGHPAEVVASEAPQVVETSQPEAKWYESLPEQLRKDGEKIFSKYDSVDKALEASIHSQKMLGKRFQDLPPEEIKNYITPEELYDMAHQRGLPKSVEEYKLEKFDSILPLDVANAIKGKALEYQLTPDKIEGLMELNMEMQQKMQNTQREQWRAASFNEFGHNLDGMLNDGVSAIREFAGADAESIKSVLNSTGLGDNPVVIKFLSNIGKAMTEDKIPHSVMINRTADLDAVSKEIKGLLNDPVFKTKWRQSDPSATAKLNELYQRQMELESR